jgi:hypothetical protein
MADVVGITLVKRFPYRGDASEEFSNTYHLTGSIPADSAAWKTLADALIAEEKKVYESDVTVIQAYGYDSDADDATAVWSYDYLGAGASVPGTGSFTGVRCPGDAAAWVRWKTSRLNTKGKPIYLRKYFHCVEYLSGSPDTLVTGQKTALEAFGTKLMDGTFTSARKIRSQHHDETIVASGASTYITTRTLKRRGKRPGS